MIFHSCVSLPKGKDPSIIHFDKIFDCKPTSYWGTPIYGNPPSLYTYAYFILIILNHYGNNHEPSLTIGI